MLRSFQILASTNITTEEQRDEVASDLNILTSNSSVLTEEDIKDSVATVESIVEAEDLNQNVVLDLLILFMTKAVILFALFEEALNIM